MPPGSLWRPTAASAADARHPQFAQSGLPPNWQGVIGFSKFADTHAVVFAKMQSSGECGRQHVGVEQRLVRAQFRVLRPNREQIRDHFLAVGLGQALGRDFADLRRVEAEPDLRHGRIADQNFANSSR